MFSEYSSKTTESKNGSVVSSETVSSSTTTKSQDNDTFSFKDGLSINEAKVSILMILLVVVTIFALYSYYKNGDFSNNLLYLLQTLILVIGGVNAVDKFTDIVSKKRSKV